MTPQAALDAIGWALGLGCALGLVLLVVAGWAKN